MLLNVSADTPSIVPILYFDTPFILLNFLGPLYEEMHNVCCQCQDATYVTLVCVAYFPMSPVSVYEDSSVLPVLEKFCA